MNENKITQQLEEYINYKRSLGYKIKHEETVLRSFEKFTLKIKYKGSLTHDIVLKWLSEGNTSNKTMGRKVEVIRPFSRYVVIFDNEAKIINGLIFNNVHSRPTPYIYTEDEAIKLMGECHTLYSPDGIRAKSTEVIIGLLWATGLRPSEPVNLNISDIDLTRGILHIRETKYSKERYIPIEKSVIEKLSEYKLWIEQKIGTRSPNDAFFYTTGGEPLTQRSLAYAFSQIRHCINAKPVGYPYVRLYDFRHTMACNAISRWLSQGVDVNSNLYILSTYMGHVKIEDTYWYLSATPGMLEISSSKYEDMFGGDYNEN